MRSCLVPTCVGVVGILLDMIQNRLCRVLTLGDQDSGQGEGIPSLSFFQGWSSLVCQNGSAINNLDIFSEL